MKYTLPLLHIEERVLESREREGKNNDISDKTLKLNKLFWFYLEFKISSFDIIILKILKIFRFELFD